MTLTKEQLIRIIYEQVGLSRLQSKNALETMLELMKSTLENGEDVLISGFGKFCVKQKKERKGRNPKTTEDIRLRARRVLTFRVSSVLRQKLNRAEKG
jgi:integration host factor subunit alpha